jgi:hypothetical protein
MSQLDVEHLVVFGTPILMAILAAALRSRSLVVWVSTFTGLVIAASALHLYAIGMPVSEPTVWLGVLCADVFPVAVASTLTRLISPAPRPWLVGVAAVVSYVAALVMGISVGTRFDAFFR